MAKSKKKSAKPSTAQSTLAAFQQDLFKVLDGLQTQITTDATNESTALNAFIRAESTLTAKSTDFGGPSPYFVNPTWKGSTKPNGAKSYKNAFEPIIKHVLSMKTAAQDEQAINMEELTINLINVFKSVFNKLAITKGMTKADPTGIHWVLNSVMESHAYISVSNQEGLAFQMVEAINGGKGLPSDGTFDKSNASYEPWLKKQLKTYFDSIKTEGPDIQHLTNQVLNLLKSTLSKYNQSDEDSIREWVQTTITTAPSTIAITNLQKDELVGALEQEVSKLFPQPDASYFFGNLQTILLQNIYNPPPSTVMSNKVAGIIPPKDLSVAIQQTTNSDSGNKGAITAVASGGKLSSGSSYLFEWTDSNGKSISPSKSSTKETSVIENLAPGTYSVMVSDGKSTTPATTVEVYKSNLSLKESNYKNVSLSGGDDGSITVTATGGKSGYQFVWKDLNAKSTPSSSKSTDGKSSTAKDLKAGAYSVTVTDSANPAAKATILLNITQPAYSAHNGIKYLIEKILGISGGGTASAAIKKMAAQLEGAFKQVVKIAIDKTFDDLTEFGAQGRLMSSTYDYQLISRISDYTTSLVDELRNDYNTYIPTNSSNALNAAQEITAAAVAFREFAMSLPAVADAFKSELNHTTKSNTPNSAMIGNNYTQIKNLIDNDPNTSLTNLTKLADAIYLSTNKSKVPLIQIAEYEGVALASSTAGLNTSLTKLLTGEQSSALNSLNQMKQNAKSNYEAAYKSYDLKATEYFAELEDYIDAKQTFNYDMLRLDAVNNALETLTEVIETGVTHAGFTDVYAKT